MYNHNSINSSLRAVFVALCLLLLTNSQPKYAWRIPAIALTMPITILAIVPPPRVDPLLAPWLDFPVGSLLVVELRVTIVTEEGTNKVTKAVRCQRLMLELPRVVGFEPLKALPQSGLRTGEVKAGRTDNWRLDQSRFG